MKKITLILLLLTSMSLNAQIQKINYWTWKSNHPLSIPEKFNRFDWINYFPKYYHTPTISLNLKSKNYFYYKEKRKTYKFIF